MESVPKIVFLAMAIALWSMPAPAQEGPQDFDPFYSTGLRSSPTESSRPDPGWGRDPFLRPFEGNTQTQEQSSQQGPEIPRQNRSLTGIIYGKHVRMAIIGGEALREGSMVGDKKLVTIGRRSIVLMSDSGVKEEVMLNDFSIRKEGR